MNLLAFDTSSKYLTLAASNKDGRARSRNVILKNKLSEKITTEIGSVLRSAGLSLESLDGFVIGLGPGAFTSLRVGISTLKALALVQQKPIVGICSLDATALEVKEECEHLCVLNDARRNLAYARQYIKTGEGFVSQGPCVLKSPREILSELPNGCCVVSDAIEVFETDFHPFRPGKNFKVVKKNIYPRARNLIPLCREAFRKKEYISPAELTPLYLYPEDCQVRKS